MTNKIIQFFHFSEDEYQKECSSVEEYYANSTDGWAGKPGAVAEFEYPSFDAALTAYQSLIKDGYSKSVIASTAFIPPIGAAMALPSYTLRLVKPKKVQEKELKLLFAELREQMIKDVAQRNVAETERQIQLRLEAKQREREREEEYRQQAEREEVMKEFEELYGVAG